MKKQATPKAERHFSRSDEQRDVAKASQRDTAISDNYLCVPAVRRAFEADGSSWKTNGSQCPRFSTNNLIKEELSWKRPLSARRSA
ncbi:hypothetical protein HMPREF0239_01369 [Clostridium sp. ATCC BAA-442]|nr:hypothetical protein HMPREF0239_01369 [Clostridium sp. ATCC BAA-442]